MPNVAQQQRSSGTTKSAGIVGKSSISDRARRRRREASPEPLSKFKEHHLRPRAGKVIVQDFSDVVHTRFFAKLPADEQKLFDQATRLCATSAHVQECCLLDGGRKGHAYSKPLGRSGSHQWVNGAVHEILWDEVAQSGIDMPSWRTSGSIYPSKV
ncbi:hypothetical protein I314_03622 [Cryptococcus bacillisporus CA1873]|uniref:Uncharacterized protein n=1 Tax=Cryptococcus bacillisporus CA1873 TaxID=1296111 RepID=A0ABR5B9S7_CRYGA|nr:hypothetical protein I314_03622 [Cryptococcus bacillisporus CA1873]|eukprot:KIR60331.1 hypothetical protein I314_03622 [Cryptococcus gattii CA1873]